MDTLTLVSTNTCLFYHHQCLIYFNPANSNDQNHYLQGCSRLCASRNVSIQPAHLSPFSLPTTVHLYHLFSSLCPSFKWEEANWSLFTSIILTDSIMLGVAIASEKSFVYVPKMVI